MTHDEKYRIAIEGREMHIKIYHFWMNLYAIINGALFVGLYNVSEKNDSDYIIMGILVLGCLAGWFWNFSVSGFHEWMISWIKNIQRFEENHGVYKVFCEINRAPNEKISPLSTPKLTKAFTFSVAIVWSILLVLKLFEVNRSFIVSIIDLFGKSDETCRFIISLCIIILLVIFLLICRTRWCKESDLSKSHTVIYY